MTEQGKRQNKQVTTQLDAPVDQPTYMNLFNKLDLFTAPLYGGGVLYIYLYDIQLLNHT